MDNERVIINPYESTLPNKTMSERQKDYNQKLSEQVARLYKDRYLKEKK